MLRLSDFGATVGQDASTALLRAFDAAVAKRDQTILVDGQYLISNPVDYNFSRLISSLKIVGQGSRSYLVPRIVDGKTMLTLAGVETLTFEDVVFAGYPGDVNDAGSVIALNFIQQANFSRTNFYGIACTQQAAMVKFTQSDVAMRDCLIQGCAGATGNSTGLVHNYLWRGFLMERCQFRDYGTLNDSYQSKTPLSASYAWVGFGNVSDHPTNAYSPSIIRIQDSRFDEGALHAISLNPNAAESAPIRGLHVKNIAVNVFSSQSGIYAQHTRDIVVEDSLFGWASNAPSKAIYTNNVDRVQLIRCIGAADVTEVAAEGKLEDYYMENCSGFSSISVPRDKLRVVVNGINRIVS